MDLFSQVSADIVAAMKARDKVSLQALRNIKKVFLEAKTAPGSNDELPDADAVRILQKLAKQGKDSAAIYTEQGRADLAEEELAQVAVIERYLPKALTDEELTAALRAIIAEVGATSPRDMGKVMGVATKQLAGKAEGRLISAKVKELLS
ncbi:MAG: GatB/YqeY domain-containing protein [Bacteroidaceae bacterium]|nr:GatB/YqeY domain-containing protein [Bacteroidaceae bacterium]